MFGAMYEQARKDDAALGRLPNPEILSAGLPDDVVYRRIPGYFPSVLSVAHKTIDEAAMPIILDT